MIELRTKRLRILPLSVGEMAELIKKPQQDESFAAALNEMYKGSIENPKDFLWYTNWQIFLISDGTYIGSLCFKGAPINGAAEIGYGIDEPFRNRGYASEAVKAFSNWALARKNVYFVIAETKKDNSASLGVLRKNGFVSIGEGREGERLLKERAKSSWMSAYLCIGMSCGLALGASFKNTGMGIAVGMCIGIAIGTAMDDQDKKTREKFRKELK